MLEKIVQNMILDQLKGSFSKGLTMTKHSDRRDFLKTSTAVAAGLSVPYFPWTQKAFANVAANDRPRVGCIGVGSMGAGSSTQKPRELGRGSGDAGGHARYGDILAVCDVDARRVERAKEHPRIGNGKADGYKDYRDVLDRQDIDVVSIVTTDHWHVKIAVEALEAGKHVFCQKPLTLTLEENQLIRNACKKHPELVFLVGTQQRSSQDRFLRAINMVQKGLLGDIKKVTVGINGGVVGGPFKAIEPPAELDWEMWLGQAPYVEYRAERCHYEFRWWYEYSGGKFTDWGAHHVDIASWALGVDQEGQGPVEIDGTDAKHPVPYKDGFPTVDHSYNTAHDYAVKCKYENGVEMVIDSRSDNGIRFEGTKGRIFVSRGKIVGKPIEENWDEGKFGAEDLTRLFKGKQPGDHKGNFYQCIREGGLPVSDVFTHVQAMSTCHLAAIAARLGRVIKWDPKTEQILDDTEAASFASRPRRKGYEIIDVMQTA